MAKKKRRKGKWRKMVKKKNMEERIEAFKSNRGKRKKKKGSIKEDKKKKKRRKKTKTTPYDFLNLYGGTSY